MEDLVEPWWSMCLRFVLVAVVRPSHFDEMCFGVMPLGGCVNLFVLCIIFVNFGFEKVLTVL